MKIRHAKSDDKNPVLAFCNHTFSWGDYIHDVWDIWIKEGNLYVITHDTIAGLCHGAFFGSFVWIEGIRIHPSFRNQGLASHLVRHIESLAAKRKIRKSCMLIDTNNLPSLCMAKKLGYEILDMWNFYSLLPQQTKHASVQFGYSKALTLMKHYVKSWRWISLDEESLSSLLESHKIIYSDSNGDVSSAIMTDSEHFEKTMIVTLHSGSNSNTTNLLLYIQNFGFKNNYRRIQILTKNNIFLPLLEYRISFNLMSRFI